MSTKKEDFASVLLTEKKVNDPSIFTTSLFLFFLFTVFLFFINSLPYRSFLTRDHWIMNVRADLSLNPDHLEWVAAIFVTFCIFVALCGVSFLFSDTEPRLQF